MGLGMRPANFMALAIAAISIALCFVGLVMTLAELGEKEQSVSGIGWAANMAMAEMISPCLILFGIGGTGFTIVALVLSRKI